MKYPNLFSPIKIGNLLLKNRIFAAPTSLNWSAVDGNLTPETIAYYELKAKGCLLYTSGKYETISEQFEYRKTMIKELLDNDNISLTEVDAFVGRGGGLLPMEGGTYEIDDLLLEHAREGANGVSHPAQLGPQIAKEFASIYNAKAFVVNPPDVDELHDLARMTGIKGIYRVIHLHAPVSYTHLDVYKRQLILSMQDF